MEVGEMKEEEGVGGPELRDGPLPPHSHPSLDIVSASGTELAGRRIVLCVAGSVAAYKAIELARLLMRHGASVTCAASRTATRLIRPAYLKWATGNDVITELTGDLEHIRLADYGRSHLVVAYPATANTVGRLANGIDDGPVSTILTVALGSGTPILICPAMHESMYDNPAVARNIKFLEDVGRAGGGRGGVMFMQPQMIEGKAKAPEPGQVLDRILGWSGAEPSPLRGKHVLLTAGPTAEFIDPVRVITNRSSGRTGVLLASELLAAGATVRMIYGPGGAEPPGGAEVVRVETSSEMRRAVVAGLRRETFDVIIMAAAVSDYAPAKRSGTKLESSASEEYAMVLRRVPKIIDIARRMHKDALLVGFKAEANVSKKALTRAARDTIARSGADLVVANDIGRRYQRDPRMNNVLLVDGSGGEVPESGWHRKEAIARFIRKAIEGRVEAAQGAKGA